MFGNEFIENTPIEKTENTIDAMEAADMENLNAAEAPDISEAADTEQLMDALQLTSEEAEAYQSFDSLPIEGGFIDAHVKSDDCSWISQCSGTNVKVRCYSSC